VVKKNYPWLREADAKRIRELQAEVERLRDELHDAEVLIEDLHDGVKLNEEYRQEVEQLQSQYRSAAKAYDDALDEVERLRVELKSLQDDQGAVATPYEEDYIRLQREVERLRYTMYEATVTLAGLAEREYAAKLAHDRLCNALAKGKDT
jgi:chromosome segregation ATPase